MSELLHNPNCLLSLTGHHIYECHEVGQGLGYEVCKICGTRHDGLRTFIDEDDERNKYLFGGMRNREASVRGGLAAIGIKRKSRVY